MWSNNLFWYIFVPGLTDQQLYKCCEPPAGYYIDYLSCYFQPTHDQFFEYYDTGIFFIVYCAQGFVMTGISKKINPYLQLYALEWIQCCRIGFGPHKSSVPPVIYNEKSGAAAYYAQRSDPQGHTVLSNAHQLQYRTTRSAYGDDETDDYFLEKLNALNETDLFPELRVEVALAKSRIRANRTSEPHRNGMTLLRKSLKIDRDSSEFSSLR